MKFIAVVFVVVANYGCQLVASLKKVDGLLEEPGFSGMWMMPAGKESGNQVPEDIYTSEEVVAESRDDPGATVSALRKATDPQHVAVVVRGEAFRSPDRKLQHEAWQSILDFLVKPLEAQNFQVDVISATYSKDTSRTMSFKPAWLDKMKDIFGSRLKQDIRMDHAKDNGQPGYVCRQCQAFTAIEALKAVGNGNSYQWIVLLRHDLILKTDLAQPIVKSNPDGRFLFPFRMASSPHAAVGFYWVPDTIQVFDGEYLDNFLKAIDPKWPIELDMYDRLNIHGKVPKSAFGFVLPEVWGYANPLVYQNPLYKIAGRTEGPVAPATAYIKPPVDCTGGLCSK